MLIECFSFDILNYWRRIIFYIKNIKHIKKLMISSKKKVILIYLILMSDKNNIDNSYLETQKNENVQLYYIIIKKFLKWINKKRYLE